VTTPTEVDGAGAVGASTDDDIGPVPAIPVLEADVHHASQHALRHPSPVRERDPQPLARLRELGRTVRRVPRRRWPPLRLRLIEPPLDGRRRISWHFGAYDGRPVEVVLEMERHVDGQHRGIVACAEREAEQERSEPHHDDPGGTGRGSHLRLLSKPRTEERRPASVSSSAVVSRSCSLRGVRVRHRRPSTIWLSQPRQSRTRPSPRLIGFSPATAVFQLPGRERHLALRRDIVMEKVRAWR